MSGARDQWFVLVFHLPPDPPLPEGEEPLEPDVEDSVREMTGLWQDWVGVAEAASGSSTDCLLAVVQARSQVIEGGEGDG